MKIKFLSVIVSFLILSIAVSSCLDSEENYEFSSDAMVHAFGIDTIHGKHYKFSIDQLNRRIYNSDSLPVGSDTIIDRILIDTFSVSGWITSGSPTDTLFVLADSVSLLPAMNKGNNGMEFTIHAADGVTTRKYTLEVRVHLQDPDSLEWREMAPFSNTALSGKQKAVTLKSQSNEDLWIYTSNTTAHKTSTAPSNIRWESVSGINLPADVKLSSIVNFKTTNTTTEKETLYAVTSTNKVYASENGIAWKEVTSLGNQVKTLIATRPNILTGIVEINGVNYFNTSNDGINWEKPETDDQGQVILASVPENFPIDNLYTSEFSTANGIKQTITVGTPRTSGGKQTLMWFSIDGSNWAEMSSTAYDAYCPVMNHPFVMYYNNLFYCFGDELNDIYSSIAGIAWQKTSRKFMLPQAFNDNTAPYSISIDENQFIWIVFGGGSTENKVWRGRLNKLGFKEQ